MKKKVCLLFGGAGFLGQNLCRSFLQDRQYEVRIYNRVSKDLCVFRKRFPMVPIHEGDFRNETDFLFILDDVDIVILLISITNVANKDVLLEFESNVIPTLRLLEACSKKHIQVIYFSSGGAVYGKPRYVPIDEEHNENPISPYGIQKTSLEKCIAYYGRTYGLDYKVLRISNPYGGYQKAVANQGIIAVFLAKMFHRERIEIWGDGSVLRDYIYVDDVVRACRLLMEYGGDYHIFNIGSEKGYSLNEILHVMQRQLRCVADVKYTSSRMQDVAVNILDTSLVKKEIGWNPKIYLEEGIHRMIMMWDQEKGEYLPGQINGDIS